MHVITSNCTRTVDTSVNIPGVLPNAVFTIPIHLIRAIVARTDCDNSRRCLFALCRKFSIAESHYESTKEVFAEGGTWIALYCGHLFAKGHNWDGVCGIGADQFRLEDTRLIRLPPALNLWHYDRSWFAQTTRGLYAWGRNQQGQLGVGNQRVFITAPMRVLVDGVVDVRQQLEYTLFQTASGWYASGVNRNDQLGLGVDHLVEDYICSPTMMVGSGAVTRVQTSFNRESPMTFGWTRDGLLVCGANDSGQCGVWDNSRVIRMGTINKLTPVVLPDAVKANVIDIVCIRCYTFFIIQTSGKNRCFVCGRNLHGVLGVGQVGEVRTPTELPIPVDDIASASAVTVIRSGDTLYACGNNREKQLSSSETDEFTAPVPLDLPEGPPAVKVLIESDVLFVQLADGTWFGRGVHDPYVFAPDTDTFEVGRHKECLRRWTAVNAESARVLSAIEPDSVGATMLIME